ncbi:MAG: threonine ammonia-lyase [Candidatus Amulumruptor caecigallinarius]|nr:threonine ammonia-lyase [Candidatus Amulumruptor caecigallinarius]MCM1397241.1 threonine ammonia-lyase [Candidatus Amulumruptor caecigallinarius]MCM1453085.1 threonine ammonia-lyase [bacterium]
MSVHDQLGISEVYHAAQVLRDVARHPRIIGVTDLNPESRIYLKPENLQHTGSFKLRGAYYKISQLTDEEKARGVIACSAGNHAQGVALGAAHNGIKATICLPAGAPLSKVEATRRLGAEVVMVPGVYDDAYEKALKLRDEKGLTLVHPFDDPKVIAGQGTIGLEILEEMPDVEAVVVPVGGGGLIAGVAFALKMLRPDIKVYGVQAEGAPSMVKSVAEGTRQHLAAVSTIADGIAVKEPGELTYELVREYVDDVVTVSEDEIAAAILALIEKQKLVAEGAGAVSVAAAMFNKVPIKGKKTVCIVSGGNIDVTGLNRVITRGLVKGGRNCTITLDLIDRPGVLSLVTRVLGDLGANIISIVHERNTSSTQINGCLIRAELETLSHEHIASVKQGLRDAGFKIVE